MQFPWACNEVSKTDQTKSSSKDVLSFAEYYQIIQNKPRQEIRSTSLYLKDLLDFFGTDEKGHFKAFHLDDPECSKVFGHGKVQQEIYHNIVNFCEEGFNNKFLLLVGPNGSAKSSLIRNLMRSAEIYSHTDHGALYTFSWIFPIDQFIRGGLGFNQSQGSGQLNSYAHLEDKDISAILTSELKDSPFLLIPKDYRQKLINEFAKDHPIPAQSTKKSHLFLGDISKRNRMIYDALLKNYKGDHHEVLKHIRVERFYISKRHSNSAVTIEPQMHVDAQIQQITMDRRLASLPPSLQSLNLFSLSGEVIMANRGILEFSDLLKRPLDAYKYLLTTMETKNVNLRGILTELDILFLGTSNEVHLVAFKQHPDFNSFKGRMNFIRVPYLLNYLDEMKIYGEQIAVLSDRIRFEPHALEALCLFAVATRIRPPQEKNYTDRQFAQLCSSLNPLEKCLFMAQDTIPARFESDQAKILRQGKTQMLEEFDTDNLYEGKFGISPRAMKQIIFELTANDNQISFIEVLDYLTKFIEKKSEHDFLNIPPQGEYHHLPRIIDLIKQHLLDIIDEEVRDSLGLIDHQSYEQYLERYIQNITALLKNEKIKNQVTGKFEDCDLFLVKEFESAVEIKETPEKFRSHMISSVGAFSLDNPGKKIIYSEIFPHMVKMLRQRFIDAQRKKLAKLASGFTYEPGTGNADAVPDTSASRPTREEETLRENLIKNLRDKYHYGRRSALSHLQILIKERY